MQDCYQLHSVTAARYRLFRMLWMMILLSCIPTEGGLAFNIVLLTAAHAVLTAHGQSSLPSHRFWRTL